MIVGCCQMSLYLPSVHSLKEKRSIVKSVLARLRHEFNVSTAEVDAQDIHQRAVIGVVSVSASAEYVQGQLEAVVRWVEENRPDAPILDYEIELL
ncbi:MAG TPA: DUF503 domain-containing protein [Roseiflexaceae bacterium]|nr:DUF503 domain-containing protein [Roseiflexaceae bacterium]